MTIRRFTLTRNMPQDARDRMLTEWARDVEAALGQVQASLSVSTGLAAGAEERAAQALETAPFGGTLAFELNPASLAQLQSGGAADFVAGGGGGAWTTANVAERGDVLVYTPAGGTTVTEVFMFADALPFPTTRRDMHVEVELYDATWGSGGYFGAFLLAGPAGNHGFGHLMGVVEGGLLVNNGTVVPNSGTGNAMSGVARFVVRGRKPAGAAPEMTSCGYGWSGAISGFAGTARRTGSSAAARGPMRDFGNNTTLASTWNDLACDRFGLVIRSSGGNPPPTQVRLMSFKVWI